MCPREITVRHRRGWLLVLRESIICANAGPRSRHPQWQSSPFLLAVSRGAHSLARRARSHCSFSTILHVADSFAEERRGKTTNFFRSRAPAPAPCAPPHADRSSRRLLVARSPISAAGSPCVLHDVASMLGYLSSTRTARTAAPWLVARGRLLWMHFVCISRAVVVAYLHLMCVWSVVRASPCVPSFTY